MKMMFNDMKRQRKILNSNNIRYTFVYSFPAPYVSLSAFLPAVSAHTAVCEAFAT